MAATLPSVHFAEDGPAPELAKVFGRQVDAFYVLPDGEVILLFSGAVALHIEAVRTPMAGIAMALSCRVGNIVPGSSWQFIEEYRKPELDGRTLVTMRGNMLDFGDFGLSITNNRVTLCERRTQSPPTAPV